MPKKKKSKQAAKPTTSIALTYQVSDQFEEDYVNSSPEIQKDIERTLKLIVEHKDYTPGMKLRKLHGDIWYIKASSGARITFSKKPNKVIFLRRCGDHDILNKETSK